MKERARAAARSVILSILGRLVPLPGGPFLRALYFHGVPDEEAEQFLRLMQWCKQTGTFVSTETLISMLEGRIPLEGRYFHLSFDDGCRNVFRNAVPVLQRLEVPAVFFVATGSIGADGERAGMERMTWDELRTLQGWGFEVGSHSRAHPRFAEILDGDRLEAEIAGSKHDIEERLGVPCKYIAWPYGRAYDVNERSLEVIAKVGYHACFGGYRGSVVPGKTSRWRIPRHHLAAGWSRAHVRFFAYGYGERRLA